jgi:excisionase family DNA binding protein
VTVSNVSKSDSTEDWLRSKKIFFVKEIAEQMNVSSMTVHRAIAAGNLKALLGGRVKRITRSALCEWLGVDEKSLFSEESKDTL